jgi:excisionase family DNA binding protein
MAPSSNVIPIDRARVREVTPSPALSEEFRFLDVSEVAALLKLPVKTIYELAQRGYLPGRKYGKQWRFLLPDVIEAHHRGSVVATGKEVTMHGRTTQTRRQDVLHRPVLRGPERTEAPLPPFDWSRGYEEGRREAGSHDQG